MTAVPARHLLLLALGLGLAACELDAATTRVKSQAPGASASAEPAPTPATPGPRNAATPFKAPPPAMATPQAVATPIWTATPARPDASAPLASPPGSPGLEPGPSASPSLGPYAVTERPLDLALSGPGYMVLSAREAPSGPDDLLFTRGGRLELTKEPEGSRQVWRLRLAPAGLLVMGLMQPSSEATGTPEEADSVTGLPVTTRWGVGTAMLTAVRLDADRNPTADTRLRVDAAGTWLLEAADPRGDSGAPVRLLLAIASFEAPSGLQEAPGLPGVFRHAPAAGRARLRVAASGRDQVLVLGGRLPAP